MPALPSPPSIRPSIENEARPVYRGDLPGLGRTIAKIAERKILDVRDARLHLVFGRELAIQEVGERIAVRQIVVSERRNRDVEFDRIHIRAEIPGLLAFLQEVGDVAKQSRIAGLGQFRFSQMPALVKVL